jgi:hypothetical protein
MNSLAAQSSLSKLDSFASKVRNYPVSVRQLLRLAKQNGEPPEVINFYKSFASDAVFDNPDDLSGRTEQVEIMRQEEADMPKDDMIAPQED